MIELSPAIKDLLLNPTLEFVYLVDIDTVKLTNHYSNIELSDGSIYLGNSGLVAVDPPQTGSSVDRQEYKITIVDNEFSFSSMYSGGLVGKLLKVRVLFIDPSDGSLFKSISDLLTIYIGKVDNMGYTNETESVGSTVVNITGSSPMADLDRKKEFLATREAMRNINPIDTAFDDVYEGSASVKLRWGKA